MDEAYREARLKYLEAQTKAKEAEAYFGQLKIEEAERQARIERATPGEDNVITFSQEITPGTVQAVIRTLDVWSRREPGCHMTIIINTPGGDSLSMAALYDFMGELKERGHRITTKVIGAAMSAGVAILQAGNERIMSPNSWLLIHELQVSGLEGNMTEIGDHKNRLQRLNDMYFNIVSDRSTLTLRTIKNKCKGKDWFLSAEEAVKYGFADRIAP